MKAPEATVTRDCWVRLLEPLSVIQGATWATFKPPRLKVTDWAEVLKLMATMTIRVEFAQAVQETPETGETVAPMRTKPGRTNLE